MIVRVKFLLIALGALLCTPLVERVIVQALLEPIRQREGHVAHLETSIQRAEAQCARIEAAQRKLKQWASQSLPPDPATASARYQNWLLELATRSELDNVIVTPNRVVSLDGSYFRIPFALQARATLDQLCDFIYEFQGAGLLHRITQIKIEGADRGDHPTLEISLNLEGAALPIASPRSTLFPDSEYDRSASEGSERDRSTYEQIGHRNLFVRNCSPVSTGDSKEHQVQTETPVDQTAQVYLIALLTQNDQREGWLYDRKNSRKIVLSQGARFEVAGISGSLVMIERDFVLFQMDGVTWRLELGHSLRQKTRTVNLSNL